MPGILSFLKGVHRKYDIYYFRKHPFLWLYAAYLTIRYVDKHECFPAIKFTKFLKVKIYKERHSRINIKERLLFEPWINGRGRTVITLQTNALLDVQGEFTLGDNIKIFIASDGQLILKGKRLESASGITANSVILVREHLQIGEDCIIAWDTFMTDCDWHTIGDKPPVMPTYIGDHVWIGVGAKILKGADIGCGTIITSNTVVLQNKYPEKALISGNPGKVVKTDVSAWKR